MWVFLVGYGMDSMILPGMVCGTVRYGIVCGVARYVIWYVGGMVRWHGAMDIIYGTVCDMVRSYGKYLCRWHGMMTRCGGISYGTVCDMVRWCGKYSLVIWCFLVYRVCYVV